jgi:hypothetical protein
MVSPTLPYDISINPQSSTQKPSETTHSSKIAHKILSHRHAAANRNIKAHKGKAARQILKKSLQSRISEAFVALAQHIRKLAVKLALSFTALIRLKKINTQMDSELHNLKILKAEKIPGNEKKILSLQHGIQRLQQLKNKCLERLFNLRKLPAGLFDAISGILSTASTIGSLTKLGRSEALATLRIVGTWMKGVAAGISLPIGFLDIGLGINRIVTASRKRKEAEQALQELEKLPKDPTIPDALWNTCADLRKHQLLIQNLKALRNWRKSVYQVCGGSLAVVGAGLGLASLFTGGWAGIGIGIAAGVTGAIGMGVALISYLRKRPLSSQIKQIRTRSNLDLENIAASIRLCSKEQKESLATLLRVRKEELEIDPYIALSSNFRELLSKDRP